MGTRYQDQPVEHWAGPESLDPTPVWKQYLLVALLLVVGLVAVIAISVTALAPYLATPPALVAGDRLVLAAGVVPAVGAQPKLIGAQLPGSGRRAAIATRSPRSTCAARQFREPRAASISILSR